MTSEQSAARPARILIVDDSRVTTRALEFHLARVGYQVSVAHDGGVALEMAKTFQPDAILLDLNLPISRAMKSCENCVSTPILPAPSSSFSRQTRWTTGSFS